MDLDAHGFGNNIFKSIVTYINEHMHVKKRIISMKIKLNVLERL